MDLLTYALLLKKALNSIPDEVGDWLEDNIDPDSGYALDRTLALQAAAAPADMLGSVKNDLTKDIELITGNKPFVFEPGRRPVYADSTTDDCVDSVVSDSDFVTLVTPCTPGDTFTIRAYGAASTKAAYGWANSSKKGIARYGTNSLIDATITAPDNAAYLIINNKLSSNTNYYAYKGENLSSIVSKSLKYIRQTTSSDNIDEMWNNGVYVRRTSGTGPANSPTTANFVLFVLGNLDSASSKYKVQLLFSRTGTLFSRTKDDTTITAWNSIPLNDTWSDKAGDPYMLIRNELPIDSYLVKGNYNTSGGITTGLGVSTYPMYDLTVGTKINVDLPEGFMYTVWEGNSRTSTKRTHQTVTDESFVTARQYVGFIFYKVVDGETINATVDDIKGNIKVTFAGGGEEDIAANYAQDTPENQGQANVLKRAAQVIKIPFEALAELPYFSNHNLAEGTDTTGIPYSSVRPEGLYVPNSVSFHSFITASKNPNSYLYKKKLAIPEYSGRTYYGSVCSSFVAYCYGIDEVIPTTISFDTYPGFTQLPEAQQNVQSLKLGDMLNRSAHHIVIITGLFRNKYGNICYVEASEETSTSGVWKARSALYTAQRIKEKYFDSSYLAYRYDNIADVTYEASPWVHIDESEFSTPVWNENIVPRRGDKANWPAGSDVVIDVLTQGDYTDYEYENIDTSDVVSSTIPGDVITLSSLDPGRYKMRLKENSNYSSYIYFDVIETAGTTFEVQSDRKVKVTWSTSLGTASSINFCVSNEGTSDYMAVHAFHVLTSEEITAGYAIVNAPTANATLAPSDVWLMKVMYKTEFGLYSGQLTEVQVTSIGTVTESDYSESDVIVDVT